MKDLIKKSELSNFWKEIKLPTTNHKQVFFFFNLLFINCIFLDYPSLNISSTIKDLKMKGISKYK